MSELSGPGAEDSDYRDSVGCAGSILSGLWHHCLTVNAPLRFERGCANTW